MKLLSAGPRNLQSQWGRLIVKGQPSKFVDLINNTISIGSHHECEVKIEDTFVPEISCQILFSRIPILQVHSGCPVLLNQKPIEPSKRLLENRDTITISGSENYSFMFLSNSLEHSQRNDAQKKPLAVETEGRKSEQSSNSLFIPYNTETSKITEKTESKDDPEQNVSFCCYNSL